MFVFDVLKEDAVAGEADKDVQSYIPRPNTASTKKKKKHKSFPTADSTEMTIINDLWHYNNADAS